MAHRNSHNSVRKITRIDRTAALRVPNQRRRLCAFSLEEGANTTKKELQRCAF